MKTKRVAIVSGVLFLTGFVLYCHAGLYNSLLLRVRWRQVSSIPSGEVRGVLKDSRGRLVSGASVHLRDLSGGWDFLVTDSDGRFVAHIGEGGINRIAAYRHQTDSEHLLDSFVGGFISVIPEGVELEIGFRL
jgi:hypothetical protein